MENKKIRNLVILALILLIAVFFRLWKLDSIPPGLYPDVAMNGNNAISALANHDFKVFYIDNNGREGFFINLVAFSFVIFGVSIWSMKIVAALFGIFTVLGTYLVAKEIFIDTKLKEKAETIALLSSFFLAVSFWHTLFSRIGFRAIMVPFVLVFGIYFLLRGFRTKKILDFVLAGTFWGLGLHTYISFRMAVLILAAIFFLKIFEYFKENKPEIRLSWCWSKMFLKDGWWKFKVFVVVLILVFLPLGFYFLHHPADFMGRAAGVSIFIQENPIKSALVSFAGHMAMFNFRGDLNWRHNFSGSPMLFWPVGILFLFGFVLSIFHLFKSAAKKDCPTFTAHTVLLSWFFAMLLPGILSAEGIPHALRVIGVIPVVCIFAGFGGKTLYDWTINRIKYKKIFLLVCLLLLLLTGWFEFHKYFYLWAGNKNVEGAFTVKFARIGNYLNSLPENTSKYVIVNEPGVPVPFPDGIPMPSQTPMFIESTKFGKPQAIYLLPDNLNQVKIDKDTVILPMGCDDKLFSSLQSRWPEGKITFENNICIFRINY